MPNSNSAAKRLRQDAGRRLRNKARKRQINTHQKAFLARLAAEDAAGANEALGRCFSALDRAAKSGAIHRNKAARKKSRLTARLRAAMPAAVRPTAE